MWIQYRTFQINDQTLYVANYECSIGCDPGFPVGVVDLQRGHFSVKMDVKMKELNPVGGLAPENFVCRLANAVLK